jgi:hypothetical protein
MTAELNILTIDTGTADMTVATVWRRLQDGTLELVDWKATNHGSEAAIVEPPAALSIAEPR